MSTSLLCNMRFLPQNNCHQHHQQQLQQQQQQQDNHHCQQRFFKRTETRAEGIASTSKEAAASVIIIIVIVININININTKRYRLSTLIDKRGFLPTFSLVNVRNFFRLELMGTHCVHGRGRRFIFRFPFPRRRRNKHTLIIRGKVRRPGTT